MPTGRTSATRRQAFYTDLGPGSYRFRVVASNNGGVWNETGAALEFSIAPAYYQPRWFAALVIFGTAALLWLAYRLRVAQLARQFNRTLDARLTEIARADLKAIRRYSERTWGFPAPTIDLGARV